MWRPKNWDGQAIAYKEADRLSDMGMTPSYQDLVEAGADAMLRALARDKGLIYWWKEDIDENMD